MWIGIVSISMLFAALTTAMVVRAGTSAEWVRTQIPHALYFNTAILFLSSATLEISRGFLREGAGRRFAQWLYITTTLGIAFIAGQLYAWHELAVQGIYLTTNPSSSFFYVLTAAHGLHLLGGVAGLFYLVLRSPQIIVAPRRRIAVDVTAIYWHFMDGLWIYLLVLLVVKL